MGVTITTRLVPCQTPDPRIVFRPYRCAALHGVADDHDDPSPEGVQDARPGTLHQLPVRTEGGGVGQVDAAGQVASVEAGGTRVKEALLCFVWFFTTCWCRHLLK